MTDRADVLAPLAGRLIPLSAVPDPVFAGQLVGSGVAIEPTGEGAVTVGAPLDGTVLKLHPHAVVVLGAGGVAVLVHVGIDTVGLRGEGLTPRTTERAVVRAGDPLIDFDPAAVRARGLSAVCPVVLMDSAPGAVPDPAERLVAAGEVLFRA
ncbi:PTS sugar transporter subunit IIA [Tsukamurella soli]|uniref:PTS sugar transporter subunit IIA n=1 Tax=Tsukamurella soli TaxID=644556 RepID=UPI0031E93739